MKTLMLTASALALFATPAHAQLLGGGGVAGVTGSLNGAVGSTLRAPSQTVSSVTRGTLRGNTATRGNQNVDRKSGSVAIDRSVDSSLDATTSQLLGTTAGAASAGASGSADASGSGSANAQLLGTDAVVGAVRNGSATAGNSVANVRNIATPAVGSARDRILGFANQGGSAAGSANGAASGTGMIDGGLLALAGSGAAEGQGAFSVAPGMPVQLPSGEQVGMVQDIVATRSGEVLQLVIQTQDGLTTIPSTNLTASGSALIVGQADSSASNDAPAKASGTE